MLSAFNKLVFAAGQPNVARHAAWWLAAILVTGQVDMQLGAAEPVVVRYLWESDPDLDVPWFQQIEEYTPSAKPGQIKAPAASQRMDAAQAIVRVPSDPDFDAPALRKALLERLEAGESQPSVRAELVAALCELDDGSVAEKLWSLLGDDLLVRPTLEKACIRWSKPMPLEIWRERLSQRQGSEHEITRALEGIGATGTQEDLSLLKAIASDGTEPAPRRLVAARAIGRLSAADQLTLAKELRSSSAMHADLLAVEVLGKHSTPEVKAFMADIADHGAPPAQRHAYRWMCELDPAAAQGKAALYAQHADAEIRRLSLLQINQTEGAEAIAVLTRALGDENPNLRETARHALLSRSSRSAEHLSAVEATLAETLRQAEPKPLEQCVRLTVELEQKQHIPRLLELLDNPNPEVCITAAWALRHLVTEEETLAKMLTHAQQLSKRLQEAAPSGPHAEEFELRRVAHLLEAFGLRHYEPAKETLLLFVPKDGQRMGMITRMAGIWACGRIWEGEENRALADELCKRIADKQSMFPEPMSVRYAATIALGWLADPKTRQALVTNDEARTMPIGIATAWALKRIDERAEPAE